MPHTTDSNIHGFDFEKLGREILERFFTQGGGAESANPLVRHQVESYNDFLDRKLFQVIDGFNPIQICNDFNAERGDYQQKMSMHMRNPVLSKPMYQRQDGTMVMMTPEMARLNNLTYAVSLHIDIHITSETIGSTGLIERDEKTIGSVFLGKIPVMVRSKACVLTQMPGMADEAECRYDPGGYFIVNGNEKVVISQDRITENRTLVFAPSSGSDSVAAEIRSVPDNNFLPPKTSSLHLSTKGNHMGHVIRFNTQFIRSEIPLFIIFRALGIESDREILEYILLHPDSEENDRMRSELLACIDDASGIYTQEDARTFLLRHINTSGIPREYMDQPERIRAIMENMLHNDLLPHSGPSLRRKAMYLGFMVRKLLSCYLGYTPYDNRDSYIHKRIDTTGVLMASLFRQCYGRMVKDMRSALQREMNQWKSGSLVHIINTANIPKFFKSTILENSLRYALATGNWGIKTPGSFNNIRQGVAQVLNRMSYLASLSHLRRINTPMEKTGKLVQPRKLDITQYGTICPAETPEGASVGLVKNMAMTTWITQACCPKYLRSRLHDRIGISVMDDDLDAPREFLRRMGEEDSVHVFVNGDIVGYTKDPIRAHTELVSMKRAGEIAPTTAIVWDRRQGYISVSTEGGRLCRPLHVVKQNKLAIIDKPELLHTTQFEGLLAPMDNNDLTEGVLELLDTEEMDKALIAMFPKDLSKKPDTEFLVKPQYTHCEIHPSATVGVLASNIPFSDHNQSPRNVYQCIWEEEPVYMADGSSKQIKDIKIGDEILTFNPKTMVVDKTHVVNHIVRPADKKVFTIVTLSGSCITATEDHKFMTNKGWLAVKDFDDTTLIGVMLEPDPIVVKPSDVKPVETIFTEKDMVFKLKNAYNLPAEVIDHHVEESKRLGLLPLTTENPLRMSILARIAGFLCSKGAVFGSGSTRIQVKFASLQDAMTFADDVASIGFKSTSQPTEENLCFDNDGTFSAYMLALGIVVPQWVMNGSKLVKREYLSGFQGGVGSHVRWNIAEDRNHTYSCPETRIVCPEDSIDTLESMQMYIDDIIKLFREFNVVISDSYYGTSYDAKDVYYAVCFKINDHHDNLMRCYKTIGYRYDWQKNMNSGIICEYLMWEKLYKAATIEKWIHFIDTTGGAIFVPFFVREITKPMMVADLETASEYHAFLCGDGFLTHNCAMGKQAVSVYSSNFNKRYDTVGHILHYPMRPLARPMLAKYTNSDDLPGGVNAVVAIMTYSGFNQEDSIMVNRAAMDRGLFCSTHYKTHREVCIKNHSSGEEEVFCRPSEAETTGMKPCDYSKLDENGLVPKNTFVDGNDILIGKQMPQKISGKTIMRDTSMPMKPTEHGYVDSNYVNMNQEGYKFCKTRVREYRKPTVGDKLSARHGQKGTIGMIYNEEDMPFTSNGMSPDIIINPHAIPSRMTVGQLLECVMGKAGCMIGSRGDATPYNGCQVDDIAELLEQFGMERYGNEILYDGRTGRQIHTEIFIGPTYYQRLKHMVADKCHSRGNNGPVVMLTRQPAEGRARSGGLRFGEMERDCLIAHAASGFLKERMMDASDNYRVFLCRSCGLMCTANPEKHIFRCDQCKNNADIAQVRIPYACKLLFQELHSMQLGIRIKT